MPVAEPGGLRSLPLTQRTVAAFTGEEKTTADYSGSDPITFYDLDEDTLGLMGTDPGTGLIPPGSAVSVVLGHPPVPPAVSDDTRAGAVSQDTAAADQQPPRQEG